MALIRIENLKPKKSISKKTTPTALDQALKHIFEKIPDGLWLVGGTALAGFYAEHRLSNDLDLFCKDEFSHKATTLAVKALKDKGAKLNNERTSAYYYHAEIIFLNHTFTVDVVLDENIHQIGRAIQTDGGIWVADLPTLFAMKISTLISRCSEKDLFDLDWLFSKTKDVKIDEIIQAGIQIDAGFNVENLLISLQGNILRKEACHFLLKDSPVTIDQVFKKITALKKQLINGLLDYEKKQPLSDDVLALSQSFKDQKKF